MQNQSDFIGVLVRDYRRKGSYFKMVEGSHADALEAAVPENMMSDELQHIFDTHDSISDEFLDAIEELLDSKSFILEFKNGNLVSQKTLTLKEMNEELANMRRQGFGEYKFFS